MGAWGAGNFDNDSALDLLDDFEDVLQKYYLVDKIRTCTKGEYVDAVDASQALAAIELFAVALGKPSDSFSIDEDMLPYESIDYYLRNTMKKEIEPEDLLLCMEALNRIENAEHSDLYDLWAESEDLEEWLDAVEDLKSRISK